MIWNRTLRGLLLIFVVSGLTCTQSIDFVPDDELSIAFYNLDNLFDDVDDSTHDDSEFTPGGRYQWTSERYKLKLNHMEKVIRDIVDGKSPDILGVCELESKKAFLDLLSTGVLKNNYEMVHYDSPDERGIDVALAYNPAKIILLESRNFVVKLSRNSSDKTRDILWVKALSKKTNDTIHFIVCHFPSRREGKEKSEQDRMDAAAVCKTIINEKCNPAKENLLIMGDFNDEPWDISMSETLGAAGIQSEKDLFNLMWHFKQERRGTYYFRNRWEILDHLIISNALSDGKAMDYKIESVEICNKPWMIQQSGKYKGYPLRTFGGKEWLGGYSDHLPVYMKIKLIK